MTTNEPTIPVGGIETFTPSRTWTHRMIALGAAAIVAVGASAAVIQISGNETAPPAARTEHVVDAQAVTRDLVNRGLIPAESLEPAPQSRDAVLQDLVNRGLIPRQALDD